MVMGSGFFGDYEESGQFRYPGGINGEEEQKKVEKKKKGGSAVADEMEMNQDDQVPKKKKDKKDDSEQISAVVKDQVGDDKTAVASIVSSGAGVTADDLKPENYGDLVKKIPDEFLQKSEDGRVLGHKAYYNPFARASHSPHGQFFDPETKKTYALDADLKPDMNKPLFTDEKSSDSGGSRSLTASSGDEAVDGLSFNLPGDGTADGDMEIDPESETLEFDGDYNDLSGGFKGLETIGQDGNGGLPNLTEIDKGVPGLEKILDNDDGGPFAIDDVPGAASEPMSGATPSSAGKGAVPYTPGAEDEFGSLKELEVEGEPANLEGLSGGAPTKEGLGELAKLWAPGVENIGEGSTSQDSLENKAMIDAIDDELKFNFEGTPEEEQAHKEALGELAKLWAEDGDEGGPGHLEPPEPSPLPEVVYPPEIKLGGGAPEPEPSTLPRAYWTGGVPWDELTDKQKAELQRAQLLGRGYRERDGSGRHGMFDMEPGDIDPIRPDQAPPPGKEPAPFVPPPSGRDTGEIDTADPPELVEMFGMIDDKKSGKKLGGFEPEQPGEETPGPPEVEQIATVNQAMQQLDDAFNDPLQLAAIMASFRKDNPEYYNEKGEFKGGKVLGSLEGERWADLMGLGPAAAGGLPGITSSLFMPFTQDPISDEKDFVKAWWSNKIENDIFQAHAKWHQISVLPFGVGTAYAWKDLSPKMKVASVALDAIDILTIWKGIPIPKGGAIPTKVALAGKAFNKHVEASLAAFDTSVGLKPGTKGSVSLAAKNASDSKQAYIDAVVELEQIKLWGLNPMEGFHKGTSIPAAIRITPDELAQRVANATKALDEAGDVYAGHHDELIKVVEKSFNGFGEGAELANLGKGFDPPTAAQSLAHAKNSVLGFVDEFPDVKKAKNSVEDSYRNIEENLAIYEGGARGPELGIDSYSLYENVNDILRGHKSLRTANQAQAQVLKYRVADLADEASKAKSPTVKESLDQQVNMLNDQIKGLNALDGADLQRMDDILTRVIKTFNTEKPTMWQLRVILAQDAVAKSKLQNLKEMESLWIPGSDDLGGGGWGGIIETPPGPGNINLLDATPKFGMDVGGMDIQATLKAYEAGFEGKSAPSGSTAFIGDVELDVKTGLGDTRRLSLKSAGELAALLRGSGGDEGETGTPTVSDDKAAREDLSDDFEVADNMFKGDSGDSESGSMFPLSPVDSERGEETDIWAWRDQVTSGDMTPGTSPAPGASPVVDSALWEEVDPWAWRDQVPRGDATEAPAPVKPQPGEGVPWGDPDTTPEVTPEPDKDPDTSPGPKKTPAGLPDPDPDTGPFFWPKPDPGTDPVRDTDPKGDPVFWPIELPGVVPAPVKDPKVVPYFWPIETPDPDPDPETDPDTEPVIWPLPEPDTPTRDPDPDPEPIRDPDDTLTQKRRKDVPLPPGKKEEQEEEEVAAGAQQYDRVIGWRQDELYGYMDLLTGKASYAKQPVYNKLPTQPGLTARETIRVVKKGNRRPTARQFVLDDVLVNVKPRSITFTDLRTAPTTSRSTTERVLGTAPRSQYRAPVSKAPRAPKKNRNTVARQAGKIRSYRDSVTGNTYQRRSTGRMPRGTRFTRA